MRKSDSQTSSDPASRGRSSGHRFRRLATGLILVAAFGCSGAGDEVADNGGMSGTGISQGTISAFGSIIVNAVEWSLIGATVEIDGTPSSEADLRLGMVVRIEGDLDPGRTTGTALRVRFDDAVEGPIATTPVETIPGVEKRFDVLGETIVVDAVETVFDGGAGFGFGTLARDRVVEVSGFADPSGAIRATRLRDAGPFLPDASQIELRGRIANPVSNPDGSGIFDLGPNVIRYTASTTFDEASRETLAAGDLVEVEGTLRASGNEIDAGRVEREEEGLGVADAQDVEIEGVVAACPQAPDFCVGTIPIDASRASFEPMGFVPMVGDFVEVEGSLVAGVVVAERVESEDDDDLQDARLEARVSSIDASARTLVLLGITVTADGETRLKDKSSTRDESFSFGEISAGDFLRIEGRTTGLGSVLAASIERDDATNGDDDVRLRGPVTDFSGGGLPMLEILGQPVPLDGATLYFDAMEQPRTATQFFDLPGDVNLGDVVEAKDRDALDLSILGTADEVAIEAP